MLDQLKIRASVGVVGNPSIRPYQSLARLNSQTYSFNGTPFSGYYPISVANPNLSWESTHQFDAGFDLGLASRFNPTVDYYKKKTTDLPFRSASPLESGFESALANKGSVENKGIEVGLGGGYPERRSTRSQVAHQHQLLQEQEQGPRPWRSAENLC